MTITCNNWQIIPANTVIYYLTMNTVHIQTLSTTGHNKMDCKNSFQKMWVNWALKKKSA